jgi:hypothetical protein
MNYLRQFDGFGFLDQCGGMMSKGARRKISNFATDCGVAAAHAGMTLWFRLPMFGFASLVPMAQRQAEAARMIDEKAAAMVEGALMANLEAVRLLGAVATGRIQPHELGMAPMAIAAAGLKPAFRRVRANAERLGKRAARA